MNSFWKQSMLALTALTLVSLPTSKVAAEQPLHVTINGVAKSFDAAPYLKNNCTMAPLRAIAEQLGAQVNWSPDRPDFVNLYKGQTLLLFEIGSTHALVNDKEVQLDQAPERVNHRMMVPLRALAEALAATVSWNPSTRTVDIRSLQQAQVLELPFDDVWPFDPATAANTDTLTLLAQVDEGLIRLDPNNRAIPGVAKSWEISADGLTYTFHLRPDAKWSDGSPVTAQDFAYAWKRVLNPQTASQEVFHLFPIKGAEEYNSGKVTADQVGIYALDDHTLRFMLNQPVPYFTEELALPVYFPQKQSFVEQAGSDYGTDITHVLTDGPFQPIDWEPHQKLTLKKSLAYWDSANVRLDTVHYTAVQQVDDLKHLYEAGKLDRIPLPIGSGDADSNSPEFSRVSQPIVGYLDFNEQDAVLKNPKIRKALAYAIDADQVAALRYGNSTVAATGFVPNGVADGHSGDFRQDHGDIIDRQDNAAQAKDLLQQGLKELGLTSFPPLTLLMDDLDASKRTGDFIQQQWKETLGIDVQMDYQPFKLVLTRQQTGKYDIVMGQWGADYNDPMTFLDLFRTDNPFEMSGYHNPDYDKLIDAAKQEQDVQKRQQLLSDAEHILIADDMAVAPLWFRGNAYLRKSYVKGWVDHSFGPQYDLKGTYIDGK